MVTSLGGQHRPIAHDAATWGCVARDQSAADRTLVRTEARPATLSALASAGRSSQRCWDGVST